MTKVYVRAFVNIDSNIHANLGHVRHHVTIACHSKAVMTLTANEFLYNLAGERLSVVLC